MHWTGAAINFRKKRIESYDSMNMERGRVFKVCPVAVAIAIHFQELPFQILRGYLDAEHRNKKKTPFDFSEWNDYTSEVRMMWRHV